MSFPDLETNRRQFGGPALVLAVALAAATAALALDPPRVDSTARRSPAESSPRLESTTRTSSPTFRASKVPEDLSCQPRIEIAPQPKMVFLNYFWYRPEEFQCTMLVPSEGPIDSDDSGFNGYYHRRFRRLKQHGVDILGFVLTGFDQPDFNVDGEIAPSWRHGKNLANAAWLAQEEGMPFFIYYDLNVRTAIEQKRCKTPAPADRYSCPNPEHRPLSEFNLRDADIYHQIRKDLIRIKDDLILPHRDVYYMLEDEDGELILDDQGLPRPVLGIYIARDLVPNNRIERLLNNVTKKYRQDGLGKPAFVLDTIFWNDPLHQRVVERFGDAAVAVTSFFPVNQGTADLFSIRHMVDWVPHLADLYSAAAAAIADQPDLGSLQVWPGIASMFDNSKLRTRACSGFNDPITPRMQWHLTSREDWRAMLEMGYHSAYRVVRSCRETSSSSNIERQPQALLINYENEFRESAVTDCVRRTRKNEIAYPYHFACELLRTVREEDRWP